MRLTIEVEVEWPIQAVKKSYPLDKRKIDVLKLRIKEALCPALYADDKTFVVTLDGETL